MLGRDLSYYLMVIPAILIALTVHEFAHGYVAYLLGDRTAKAQGRLTLNPLAHIDPIGFLCMIIAGFGWAKPVPINISNFKDRKWGLALTSLAGPMANFIFAFICTIFTVIITIMINSVGGGLANEGTRNVLMAVGGFTSLMGSLNIGLGVFNLLPVPPLDGSNILFPFLPNHIRAKFYHYGQYIQFGLLALLFLGVLDPLLITMRSFIENGILTIVVWIMGIFI